jgi:hypothetical protein
LWIERWCAEPAEDRGVVMTCLLADATGVLDRVNGDDELVRGRSTPHAATRWHAGDAAWCRCGVGYHSVAAADIRQIRRQRRPQAGCGVARAGIK